MAKIISNRKFQLLICALALFVAVRAAGFADYLTIDTLRTHKRALVAFVSAHYAAAGLVYITIYVLAVAFSVPGALFLTLGGGFLFGALGGTICTVIGATIGATAVFVFAKLLFGDNALTHFGPTAMKLSANVQKNAWSYLLVLRLVPLFPFFLVNLIPAFAGVRLRTYVLTTFLGIIPGTAVFSLSGAGLGDILDSGGTISVGTILTPNVIAGLIGFALLSLAAIPLRHRFSSDASLPVETEPKELQRAGR